MNVLQKDLKWMFRTPALWLVLAALSFIYAWLCWQMLDHYISIQPSLMQLPYPPTITETLWVPMVLLLAKIMILVVALTAANAMARERAARTTAYLLLSRYSAQQQVWQKFKASAVVLLFVWLHLLLVYGLLETGGSLSSAQVWLSVLGITLCVLWMLALGVFIGIHCQSSATAVLATLMTLAGLWMLGSENVAVEYGVNWLHLWSPGHHLRWLCGGEISLSSMLYFIGGTLLFLVMSAVRFRQLRISA